MKLSILTPEKMLFSGEVDSVSLPGAQAPFTVLPNHAPMLSSLQSNGRLSYLQNNKMETLIMRGGFVEVLNNCITVCTESGAFAHQEETTA